MIFLNINQIVRPKLKGFMTASKFMMPEKIKIFPDKVCTAKPAETRMGKGKGSPEYWVAVVKPGRIMFEIGGVSRELAIRALELAAQKLPNKVRIIEKN